MHTGLEVRQFGAGFPCNWFRASTLRASVPAKSRHIFQRDIDHQLTFTRRIRHSERHARRNGFHALIEVININIEVRSVTGGSSSRGFPGQIVRHRHHHERQLDFFSGRKSLRHIQSARAARLPDNFCALLLITIILHFLFSQLRLPPRAVYRYSFKIALRTLRTAGFSKRSQNNLLITINADINLPDSGTDHGLQPVVARRLRQDVLFDVIISNRAPVSCDG